MTMSQFSYPIVHHCSTAVLTPIGLSRPRFVRPIPNRNPMAIHSSPKCVTHCPIGVWMVLGSNIDCPIGVRMALGSNMSIKYTWLWCYFFLKLSQPNPTLIAALKYDNRPCSKN